MMTIFRFFYVLNTLVKYGVDQLIPASTFHFVVSLFVYLLPGSWGRDLSEKKEIRLRKAIEALGPIYVKFGQAISTRPDLLPKEMATELSKLQDHVAPFDKEVSLAIIEDSLRDKVDCLFEEFDGDILGSASVAQVHAARLKTGEQVIVKVLRPGIKKTINQDVRLMKMFASFVNFLSKDAKRLRLPEVVCEFEKTVEGELDLMQEAANGSVLRENFKNSDILYVPKIYWDYCARDVLVMERVFGVSISDKKTLIEKKVNLKKLAGHGVTIFFTQVFFHQYFHADMHPGNIFVDIQDPENPKYIAIDFGIMGSLSNDDQYYLAENFLAFFNRDYRRVARLHIDSGWVPSYVKVTDFESAIRRASEPIFGKPLKDISFAQFLLTLFQTARRFDMNVQPQLVLLQKTFFNIEGLGRMLYPELDLWDTGKPILERWLRKENGPKAILNKFKEYSGEYKEVIPKLPQLIHKRFVEDEKTNQNQQKQLLQAIVIGFLILTVSQPNLWAGTVFRYGLIAVLLVLVFQFIQKNK